MSDGSVETTCGKSFDSQPAAAGHTSSCGCEIVTDGGEDSDAAEASDGLRAELATIMPGKDPLGNLDVNRTGLNRYGVLSARNGGVTRHSVNLAEPSCTCEDWQYNTDDDREVCAHYVAAHLHAEDVTAGTIAMADVARLMVESRKLKEEAEAALEGAEEANVAARETEAAAVQEATDEEVANAEPDGQAASEAAVRLREAFGEHLDDMMVQHSAGHVWFQTGKDTEDEWPYPGVDETFEAVTSPDVVEYVSEGGDDYDAHELYSEKPGEWWKNALEPGDVEEYISEVLE